MNKAVMIIDLKEFLESLGYEEIEDPILSIEVDDKKIYRTMSLSSKGNNEFQIEI